MSIVDSRLIAGELFAHAGGKEFFIELVDHVIRRVEHDVLRGAESFDDIEGCQKTVFGTFFEKDLIRELNLPAKLSKRKNPHNLHLDTRVAGFDLDIKTTLGTNWMIPRECVGHWCLLLRVDWRKRRYSIGLLRADDACLTEGCNQDKKRSVSATGKAQIDWIGQNFSYA